MSLLENPTSYNLSEKKLSVGVAIFDADSKEFVDLDYFRYVLNTSTLLGTAIEYENIPNDYRPCNTKNGDFADINLDANFDKWKQGQLINSSMCFDMKKTKLKSDYLLLGTAFKL
jgi:hypothetical protein